MLLLLSFSWRSLCIPACIRPLLIHPCFACRFCFWLFAGLFQFCDDKMYDVLLFWSCLCGWVWQLYVKELVVFIRSSGQYVNVYRRFIVIALYYSLYFISIMSLFFCIIIWLVFSGLLSGISCHVTCINQKSEVFSVMLVWCMNCGIFCSCALVCIWHKF